MCKIILPQSITWLPADEAWAWGFQDGSEGLADQGAVIFTGELLVTYRRGWLEGKTTTLLCDKPWTLPDEAYEVYPDYQREDFVGE